MDSHRAYTRFKPDNEIYSAEFILLDECRIKDVSRGGICIETTKHLYHSLNLRLAIVHEDRRITPACEVVRSSLKGVVSRNGQRLPVYEVALKFGELNDAESSFLEELIMMTHSDWLLPNAYPLVG